MDAAWKEYVRPGLRDQEVLDLFDYNDFHWNRKARFSDLRRSILSGRYQPGKAIPTKLEKAQGVCRTVVTPSPEDALILQCIVEALLPIALKKQPSQNAFFSRSHKSVAGSFTFGRDYIWFKQWPRFARKRFSISSAHEWIATTDVSTFFDNIHYSHLRNLLSSLGEIEEVILDVLFLVLDAISWRRDHLPSKGIGLPQVQFDAPRLLAHVYLFEIDAYLRKKTNNCFVRWVDDITLAVDSRPDAKTVLRDVDLLLQMRGVRINSGKTRILSAPQARAFFYQRENEYLDRVKSRVAIKKKAGTSLSPLTSSLSTSFDKFIKRDPSGHHDKVIKRYIGLFSELKSDAALNYCLSNFDSAPHLRDTVYRYITALGPSTKALRYLRSYILSKDALDDASLCQIAKVLTDWEVAPSSDIFNRISALTSEISNSSHISGDPYRFISALWMICKYSDQTRIRQYLEYNEDSWKHSEFLSRQVAASAEKLRNVAHITWLVRKVERHSFQSPLSVLTSIEGIRAYTTSIPSDIRLYMLNGNNVSTYSLQRFLVSVAVLSSTGLHPQVKDKLKSDLINVLRDPHYIQVVTAI